jgi:CRISPR-associated protein Cmr6
MAFFMLFNIPKNVEKYKLEKKLCSYGDIGFFTLKTDSKNKNFQFAQVDFIRLEDKNSFIKYLKISKIDYKEKASNKKNNTSICKDISTHTKAFINNPSFHFYKDEKYGQGMENFSLTNNYEKLFKIDGLTEEQTFELTTIYPGLLIGSGYNHPKLKDKDDDFQLGFFFDHTTGLPVISGSSIKGVLRSVFPDENDRYKVEKIEFLKEEYDYQYSDEKFKELFEDKKVIFYDAYITKTENKNNTIFGSDYITSHHSDEKMGEFKDPNPIKFLKILPKVTFRFQFQATKEQVDFFKKVLKDFGIGAKTNVGYGQFEEVN